LPAIAAGIEMQYDAVRLEVVVTEQSNPAQATQA